jgi:protein-disulfide isomerase
MARFKPCLAGETVAKIRQDLDEGARGGITGTPGFFIGTTGPDGNLKVLQRIVGAQPYANFKAALDAALTSPQPAG